MTLPLEGVLVVDFSQFLAGPYASLRLQDFGARVIKVENPDGGDLCRQHYLTDTEIDGDSTLFHAINRGKESIALDLKSSAGARSARQLIARADVMIQNFRPGVIDRLGLGYDTVKLQKPGIVYGSITGYGTEGKWADLPGQDLLAQARSGIMWLNGNDGHGPVPIGLPIADISAGANLAQGLLAALFRHARTGAGAHVETSLLESLIDLQFEFLTTYLNNNHKPPQRAATGSAHGYLPAPYGIYQTADGYLALAMASLAKLAGVLDLPELEKIIEAPNAEFDHREDIRKILQRYFTSQQTAVIEDKLASKGIWCAAISSWAELLDSGVLDKLDIISQVGAENATGRSLLRPPHRIDGQRGSARAAAPKLDADGAALRQEFGLR